MFISRFGNNVQERLTYVSYCIEVPDDFPLTIGPSPVGLMLGPSDLRNDAVQDELPDALYRKDQATAGRPLGLVE